MEKVKTGYKKTEIGVIPEDWDLYQVSNICVVINGGTPSTSNSEYWINGIIPWCTPTDITRKKGKYLSQTERSITEKGLIKSSANLLPIGTLLLCSRATIGEIKIAQREICTNQGFKSLVCKPNVYNEFIYYKILTLRSKLLEISTGSTFLELSKKDVLNLKIPLPSYSEQKAIASALSDIDALIESLDNLIRKKWDIKTATMQQLLTGKKRLPGFRRGLVNKPIGECAFENNRDPLVIDKIKAGYKKTDAGVIPEDWDLYQVSNICVAINGGTPSTSNPEYWINGIIPWCTPTDITRKKGKYLSQTERSITEKGLIKSSANLLPIGTLLLCSRATIGEIKIAQREICTNQGFKSLVCKPNVYNEFIYYKFLTLRPKLLEISTGSTFLELSKKDILNLKVPLPSYSEQQAIATILSDMDSEIEALEQRLEKTKAIKQGMMQELLTGSTRLLSKAE